MSADVLASARTGDETAFRQLTDPYRAELHLHCYRMLGSLTDAEDMLQETLLAAWRHLSGFEGRASVRAWLYRIATNRCLNALRDAKRRIPSAPQPPFEPPEPTSHTEAVWLQPYPDDLLNAIPDARPGPETRYQRQEAVQLAFVAALQLLPPRQTATLLLRDVLGFSAAEVAQMLGTTETAVKGALQRARATLDQRPAGQASPMPGSPQERELTQRFAEAFIADDIAGLVALLTDDAWLTMPPAPHQYCGAAAIAAFLRTSAAWRAGRRFQLLPTRANSQPAFGCYLPDTRAAMALPAGLIVLSIADERITAITRFLDNDLLARFGLPPTLPVKAG